MHQQVKDHNTIDVSYTIVSIFWFIFTLIDLMAISSDINVWLRQWLQLLRQWWDNCLFISTFAADAAYIVSEAIQLLEPEYIASTTMSSKSLSFVNTDCGVRCGDEEKCQDDCTYLLKTSFTHKLQVYGESKRNETGNKIKQQATKQQ